MYIMYLMHIFFMIKVKVHTGITLAFSNIIQSTLVNTRSAGLPQLLAEPRCNRRAIFSYKTIQNARTCTIYRAVKGNVETQIFTVKNDTLLKMFRRILLH